MKVLVIWIIITELPNINMIVTFTKRLQLQLRSVNHLVAELSRAKRAAEHHG